MLTNIGIGFILNNFIWSTFSNGDTQRTKICLVLLSVCFKHLLDRKCRYDIYLYGKIIHR